MLIHKQRGIGAGKINGPGGKVDPGEVPLAAAVRETEEEIGVTPLNLQLRGELWFHFSSDHTTLCFIYLADDLIGQPCATPEAIPEWYDVDRLPYDQMWEDDRHWLPLLLEGKRFCGDVVINNDAASAPIFRFINNA